MRADAAGLPVEVVRPVVAGRRTSRGPHASRTSTHVVTQVEEVWRIAEEWWREDPLARTYVRVLLDNGRVVTLFHDDMEPVERGWYEQHY